MKIIKKIQSIENVDMNQDLWVFGYGSLMWRQDFNFDEKRQVILTGFHRDFCTLSFSYRGARENPELVLGLKQDGHCHGVAFRLPKHSLSDELAKIWAREAVTNTYIPSIVELSFYKSDEKIRGLAFVSNPSAVKYVELPIEQKISHILSGVGKFGSSYEYLISTMKYLSTLNIKDELLLALYREVERSK